MKDLLWLIKMEIDSLDIDNLNFNLLTEESKIIMKAELRQTLFKLQFIKKKLTK
jgi:hypothetical protein